MNSLSPRFAHADRVLIVRLGAVGDVVNTLPALTALRQALPKAHIAWAVEPLAASLLVDHPLLTETIVLPRGRLCHARRELRRRHFDLALDFHGNLRSGLATWLSSAPLRVGYRRSECREGNFLFTNWRVKVPPGKLHRVERHLALLRGIGFEVEGTPAPVVPSDESARRRAAGFIASNRSGSEPVIAIHAGTSQFGAYKQWPAEHYVKLIPILRRELDALVVLTWGPGERAGVEAIASAAGGALLSPETPSLIDLAELLRACHLLIGSDSGPMHLASAIGTPVVALFGPKDPAIYGPYFGRVEVVQIDLPCRPCPKRRCAYPRCMIEITPEQVLAAARKLLR